MDFGIWFVNWIVTNLTIWLYNCIIPSNIAGIVWNIGRDYGIVQKVLNFQGILDGDVERVGVLGFMFGRVLG